MQNQQKVIEDLYEKGVLASKEVLERGIDGNLLDRIESESDLMVLTTDYAQILGEGNFLIDWYEIDSYRVFAERDGDDKLYQSHLQNFQRSTLSVQVSESTKDKELSTLEVELDESDDVEFTTNSNIVSAHHPETLLEQTQVPQVDSSVTVVVSHINTPQKYTVSNFADFFVSRYKFLEGLLRSRSELASTLTIHRAIEKKEKEQISIIGVVSEIGETRTGHIMLTLEDLTGNIKVLISKNNTELHEQARDIVVDEVIGISGTSGDKIVFANSIVWPDIPASRQLRKGPVDDHVLFLSDIHVGSKLFLEEGFQKFINWIRGETGNAAQREMAKKVKYIFIAGDLVDGVGIYPSQEEELSITSISGQYEEFARLIRQIPQDKKIIICPGNHDAVHLAEPQPAFYQSFSPDLFDLPNVTLVTNPSLITIGREEGFDGFDVLMYHGYSFDYYVANVDSIRQAGGYHRSDLIMKFLLKRRHLAPSFKSTPYYPSHKEDPLLIKSIPDFLITGHIHYSSVANYRGVTMISGSCWQAKTTFQEKLGHEPEPGRVPIVNLKTREIKVLRFV